MKGGWGLEKKKKIEIWAKKKKTRRDRQDTRGVETKKRGGEAFFGRTGSGALADGRTKQIEETEARAQVKRRRRKVLESKKKQQAKRKKREKRRAVLEVYLKNQSNINTLTSFVN